jgi:gamma-polyglutamate synthase
VLISSSTFILLLLLALVVTAGLLEYATLARARRRIPVRIHVNGTRGKSSVSRLLAAALREAGIVTVAKTTGTLPRMIHADGTELPVHRQGRANIIEQLQTMRTAAALNAEAIVLECMALQPILQSISELNIVRSTHTVITNARPDHLDVMGPTSADVALALAGMVGVSGRVFTAEREHLETFRMAARDRGSRLVEVTEQDISAVTAEELSRFRYTEHAENIALTLKVCDDLKIPREVALRGMWKASPDPGALTTNRLAYFGRTIVFHNGFAANDPVSTERLWNMVLAKSPGDAVRILVVNCRADRGDRSAQLARAIPEWAQPDWVFLMGTGTNVFARFATKSGMDPGRLAFVEGLRVEEIFERLVEICGRNAVLMGMGNIGGQGLDLARLFKNREEFNDA